MSQLLLLTQSTQPPAEILPCLDLLPHRVRVAAAEASALLAEPRNERADAILVDARRDLVGARSLTRLLRTTGIEVGLFVVVTEGGLAAVAPDWGFDDVLLCTCGPAELEARLRLVSGRRASSSEANHPHVIRRGELLIDEATYTVRLARASLDLTFKEFELLKFLAQHPGRVYSRQQLLQDVWGYDFFGGIRTVDVHIRRLRAKLGPEHEALIGTVRGVGYRFVPPPASEPSPLPEDAEPTRDMPASRTE